MAARHEHVTENDRFTNTLMNILKLQSLFLPFEIEGKSIKDHKFESISHQDSNNIFYNNFINIQCVTGILIFKIEKEKCSFLSSFYSRARAPRTHTHAHTHSDTHTHMRARFNK